MNEKFIFKAILISFGVHTVFLCLTYLTATYNQAQHKPLSNRVEISYRPVHKKKVVDIRAYPIKLAQRLDLNNNPKFFSDGSIPVNLGKERPMLPFGMLYTPKSQPMRNMELSRRVSIIPIKSDKINNPGYTAYCGMIHARMSEEMSKNYDTSEVGRVYLTFLLNAQGVLEDVQIIPEKTNASARLQAIALQSLRDAAPFPEFYKGMTLPEYTFNVEIDYQANE